MALSLAAKTEIGRDIASFLLPETRNGIRWSVDQYRSLIAPVDEKGVKRAPTPAESALAVRRLKWGVNRPHLAIARIDYAVQRYGAVDVAAGLTLHNSPRSLPAILALLAPLLTYAEGIVVNVRQNGWSWDRVAGDVEAAVAKDTGVYTLTGGKVGWSLPIPPGYRDIWGE